eukprot:6700277-Prymnesium_polylepis.2
MAAAKAVAVPDAAELGSRVTEGAQLEVPAQSSRAAKRAARSARREISKGTAYKIDPQILAPTRSLRPETFTDLQLISASHLSTAQHAISKLPDRVKDTKEQTRSTRTHQGCSSSSTLSALVSRVCWLPGKGKSRRIAPTESQLTFESSAPQQLTLEPPPGWPRADACELERAEQHLDSKLRQRDLELDQLIDETAALSSMFDVPLCSVPSKPPVQLLTELSWMLRCCSS